MKKTSRAMLTSLRNLWEAAVCLSSFSVHEKFIKLNKNVNFVLFPMAGNTVDNLATAKHLEVNLKQKCNKLSC